MRQNTTIIRRLAQLSHHTQHSNRMHMIKIMQRRMQSTSTSSTTRTPPIKGLLRREDVSLSMSGCGWLTPFHIGVVQAFKDRGLFDERTKVAGSSGGSLAGLIACSGLDQAEALKTMQGLSSDREFKKDIDKGMKRIIRSMIAKSGLTETDILLRCNGRLHVTVTRVGLDYNKIVSIYDSMDHLVDCVAASCFIPIYSSRRLSTSINGMPGSFMDGGVWAFTPPIFNIKVSPFPAEYVRLLFPKDVPDIALPNGRYPINKLMRWALFPPKDPQKLKTLHDEGLESANCWIEKNIVK